jgi:hypothetical protein
MEFKRMVRSLGASVAALSIVLAAAVPAAAQYAPSVTVDGQQVDFSPAPIIQSGRVFVPLRGVFERLGASVVYNNGQIDATGNGRDISLHIGSTQATVNGQPETIDVAPFIVGASTFVPLRFISTALGATVDWDNTNRVVAITTNQGSTQSYAPFYESTGPTETYQENPPPPIPSYAQPPVPEPNLIWQPGYWASGPYGYFWVPGTWVAPPQPNYQWTPGYWSANNNGGFSFIQGVWGLLVGFYGGVNYGNGYFGHGYAGGQWQNGQYAYNTAVSNVNQTTVTNVYNNTTYNTYNTTNNTTNTSYYGGPNGLHATPTPEEATASQGTHYGLTPIQLKHVQTAAQDRSLLATVNHNNPPVLTVVKPLTPGSRPPGFVPVTPKDRVAVPKHAAPSTNAPSHPEAVETAPPVTHGEPPVIHTETPATRTEEPAATTGTSRPLVRTPAPSATPRPVYHTPLPIVTPRPVVRTPAPIVTPRPVYHTPVPIVTPRPLVRTPVPIVTPRPVVRTPTPRPVVRTPVPTHAPTHEPTKEPEHHPTPEATAS